MTARSAFLIGGATLRSGDVRRAPAILDDADGTLRVAAGSETSDRIDVCRVPSVRAWVTTLTGFQAGDPVTWQHRLTVRKAKGAAAVAWEEWRDCADHAAACKEGKATGGDWSTPSRVRLVMDPKGTVRGVGATGQTTSATRVSH